MFTKIFTSLFDGSMRGQSDLILVFVNLLCHADQDGIVDRHWRAVMDETGLSQDRIRAALNALEGPDNESRSRNDDGRRIRRIDPSREWGWEIVNFKHYNEIRSAAERREYMRNMMAEKRKNTKEKLNVSSLLANVSLLAPQTQTQTQTKKRARRDSETHPSEPTSRIKLADEAWIESLKPDCRKQGINLDGEIIKAKRWLALNPSRTFTRRFFINWLNRADKNLITNDNRAPELEQRITQTQKALEEARR